MTGHGLHISSIFIGCLIYADDILLLANSVTDMQAMLDIRSSDVKELNMSFNVAKSSVMRVGTRFKRPCAPLHLAVQVIVYVDCIKYLDVVIKRGRRFACSYDHVKMSFYRAFNCIFSKSKAAHSVGQYVFT